jgi:hypothetical protein
VLATTHVLTGAVIGRRFRDPFAAFAVGVGSHFVLDALPHWGVDVSTVEGRRAYIRLAVVDGLASLAVLAWVQRHYGVGPELAGALGALTPDLDKPAAELGIDLWPDPVDRFHIGIQTGERPRRWPIDVATGILAGRSLVRGLGH